MTKIMEVFLLMTAIMLLFVGNLDEDGRETDDEEAEEIQRDNQWPRPWDKTTKRHRI